ncbi:pancreatic triacylglycerol lipase-like [Andrena cerasifolii]|uniref:pancreatic triacylglycerol lipase-like n=1 Tax=Andrena cerasifolii TaxID=2819439 RepID=UPI004037CFEA
MVGQYVSKMIEFLETKGMSLSDLTIIGHSLGAHVAGLSGYHVKNEVDYIVALDPALPLFSSKPPGRRVSYEDAKYVEVIHTNGGGLGFLNPLGHVDYYPNGGEKQVGCIIDPGGACSHLRSCLYYAESINTKVGFWSARCNSYKLFLLGLCKSPTSLMGGVAPKYNVKNKYYLTTNPVSPYARGKL